jgi:hypothetical protein
VDPSKICIGIVKLGLRCGGGQVSGIGVGLGLDGARGF